jgi:transposase-like protein
MSRKPPADELGSSQKAGHGSKYGRKKEAAIDALFTQRNVEEAARTAGIGKQTLYRWMKEPEFQADFREARRAAVSQSNARLQQASGVAISGLLKITVDGSAPALARVRAADSLLGHAKDAIEIEEIEVRLAVLEQAAKLAKPPGKD